MPSTVVVALLAGGLAAVHLLAGKLRFLRVEPRSRWLSLAGGISVAYVFVHLLPEVTERQARLAAAETNALLPALGERFLFVVVLLGFAAFYGLERLVRRSRRGTDGEAVAGDPETPASEGVFWVHVGSFAAYNALIGYLLLHREGGGSLVLYATAMGVHFVVNDYGLRDHHRDAYDRVGRWVLAVAVFAGLLAGILASVPEPVLGLLFALLAGGIVLNVIKEELPAERESRFWAFGLGAGAYTVVLLLV